jgi:hypothetical protein
VQVWTVDTVNRQPCGGRGSSPVGPNAKDLAGALAQQRMLTATEPERVELDGHDGLYLELAAPSGREYRRCSNVTLWGNDGGGMRYLQEPGQVERMWILDTPGERLVLDANYTVGSTRSQVRELMTIVRSARFPGGGSP